MSRPVIWIADSPGRLAFAQGLPEKLDYHWITDSPGETGTSPQSVDLVVISDERVASWLPEAVTRWRKSGFPILHIADGICEWRNIFYNPIWDRVDAPAPPLYQPILADKIACLGRCQSRILESFGNVGKTEVVGLPRLDGIQHELPSARAAKDKWRICVTSARNPAFTPDQRRLLLRSLLDLKEWFVHIGEALAFPVEPVWRLPEEYADKLGIVNTSSDTSGRTIFETLRACDALVTTPSTVALEGMLLGLPVALLDYYQTPAYLEAAWRISSREHIQPLISELIQAPPNRMIFQQYVLRENLECQTPALPRMQRLMDSMIEVGRHARALGEPLVFPHRILADDLRGHHVPDYHWPISTLFPGLTALEESDPTRLQAELMHARRHASEERERCQRIEEQLRQITLGKT